MDYQIKISKKANKDFHKLHKYDQDKVLNRIDKIPLYLNGTEINLNIKKLKGERYDFYRIRVGDIRVIFTYTNNIIYITKIGYRGNVY